MALDNYVYQTEFAKHHFGRGVAKGVAKGMAKGKAEGKAESLLTVLDARGLRLSREARERILACADAARLERWLARAATAEHVDDVIGARRPVRRDRPAMRGLAGRPREQAKRSRGRTAARRTP